MKRYPESGMPPVEIASESSSERRPAGSYLVITDVTKGSAGEKAGLLPDDRIIALDGEPVSTIKEWLAIRNERGDLPCSVTIRRGTEPDITDITVVVSSVFDPELQRYVLGFGLRQRFSSEYKRERIRREDGSEIERSYRMLEDKETGDRVHCYADFELSEVTIHEHVPGTWVGAKKRQARELVALVIISPNEETEPYDVLEHFNTEGAPVFVVSSYLEYYGGWHDPVFKRVVVNGLGTPYDIHVILHELQHTRQRGKRWDAVMENYGKEQPYNDPAKEWGLKGLDRLIDTLKAVSAALPEAAPEVDWAKVEVELRGKIDALAREQYKLWGRRKDAIGAIRGLLSKSDGTAPVAALKDIIEQEREQWLSAPYTDAWSASLTDDEQEQIKNTLTQSGIIFPAADVNTSDGTGMPFPIENLRSRKTLDELYLLLAEANDTVCSEIRYDELTGVCTARFSFHEWENQGMVYMELKASVPKEAYEEARKEWEVASRRAAALSARCVELRTAIIQHEIRPGVTFFDMLALPTRMAERNADAGALRGLRIIRDKTGVDLSHNATIKQLIAAYMGRLGASSQKMRAVMPPVRF